MRLGIFVGMTALAMLVSVPAMAKEISIKGNSEGELKAKCTAGEGNTFIGSGGGSSAYACVTKGGGVIACGGKTAHQKKTCTTSDHVTGNNPTHRPDIVDLPRAPVQRP